MRTRSRLHTLTTVLMAVVPVIFLAQDLAPRPPTALYDDWLAPVRPRLAS